jgi:hypothetical protein
MESPSAVDEEHQFRSPRHVVNLHSIRVKETILTLATHPSANRQAMAATNRKRNENLCLI